MTQKCVLLNNKKAHQDNEAITNIKLYKYERLSQGSRSLVPIDKDEFDRINTEKITSRYFSTYNR